ncbi:MFS transporter [Xanthocytophaga agilis]|uniref:MFS transporter n=1 Tax=Xanthocytophaga agilis TaxID=3048010 RepID=A0AAE3QZF8_9BACT|nr:MFS transporter [Xanthocytophaga agilis]MDJ1500966.1 MFS transporter [Xanthocytophaga agilis]
MIKTSETALSSRSVNAVVLVAALGYFVDIYDLLLFGIVRVPSLLSLGYEKGSPLLTEKGEFLINMQMLGMLIGGILWGIIGDKRGRLSVLFGSIFLYSIANIANGMVNSVEAYATWRFIAGVGLAGELGAGITLVAEVMPKEKRGIGTMIVASVGLTGAVVANLIYKLSGDWRMCYYIGGGLGLALLLLRIGVSESGMFKTAQTENVSKGNFLALFSNRKRLSKYLRCILIGLPTWFVIGVLVTFSPEFAKALGIEGEVKGGDAIMYAYTGIVLGDLATGALSQVLKSRLRVMYIFLTLSAITIILYLNAYGVSVATLYLLCGVLGFVTGFWVIFVTMSAEQFGTNLRATVTTTTPNFVRGALPLIIIFFNFCKDKLSYMGPDAARINAGLLVGGVIILISGLALRGLKETFHEDLNYVEQL